MLTVFYEQQYYNAFYPEFIIKGNKPYLKNPSSYSIFLKFKIEYLFMSHIAFFTNVQLLESSLCYLSDKLQYACASQNMTEKPLFTYQAWLSIHWDK